MDRRTVLEGLKSDCAAISKGLAIQGKDLDGCLDSMLEIVDSGDDWVYGRNFAGDAHSERMQVSTRRCEVMELTRRLEEIVASLDDTIQGPIEDLELPDLSDEEWQKIHAKHLKLLEASNEACARSHEAFEKWRKYYDAKVVPYRRKALGALR
jgi:hypothetical protein